MSDRYAVAARANVPPFQVGHLTDDSMALTHDVLARTGVAMAPGVDFDTRSGHHFLRLSFAGPRHEVEIGLERLVTVVG